MRLFVGIGLPEQAAGRLANAARRAFSAGQGDGGSIRSIRSIRWTRPDDMHVTLSFLGSVEPGRLEQIQQSLAELHAAPLHLELSGIGVFANAGILLAKLQPSAALLSLAEQVFLAMEGCGFPRDERPYLPHVTLARVKPRIQPRIERRTPGARSAAGPIPHGLLHGLLGGGDRDFLQSFAANEFRLYESRTESLTRQDGAHYQVLGVFPLREGEGGPSLSISLN